MGKYSKQQKNEEKPKNIKNVYLTKINSLIKLSRESLAEEDLDIFSQTKEKKIKKSQSDSTFEKYEVDNTTLKLQKNREAAKKARQRKNLYIKLLQNQVKTFSGILAEGQKIQKQSTELLQSIQSKKPKEDELDQYLSNEDLCANNPDKVLSEKRTNFASFLQEQLQANFFPSLLNNITSLNTDQAKEIEKMILSKSITHQQMSSEKKSSQKRALRILMQTVRQQKFLTDQNFKELQKITTNLISLIKNSPPYPLPYHYEEQLTQKIIEIANDLKFINVQNPQETFLEGIEFEENGKNLITAEIQKILDKLNKFENFVEEIRKIE